MNAPAPTNEFMAALLGNQDFMKSLSGKLVGTGGLGDLLKADTVNTGTGLNWFDLRPVVQLLYPYKELIPCISKLPRVSGDGGTGYHWKRITSINSTNLQQGVGEGQRGPRIAVTEQDMQAVYKTMGLESSVTFQAAWANGQLRPENRAIATMATLQSVMIGEEQNLLWGNATTPLGTTPTPTITMESSSAKGNWGGTVTAYVRCVALTGAGWLGYRPYSNGKGGIPGQIVQSNADNTTTIFGGGSSQPSAEASQASVLTANTITATVSSVAGAVAYAWYVGTSSGGELLAAITQANRATFTQAGQLGQPVTALQVNGSYQDNSTNQFVPDGVIPMIYNAIFGAAPGTVMATNSQLPSGVTITNSGSLSYVAANGNTGLTISGTNIAEFDLVLQAAYEQYKIGFDRIFMSSADLANFMGTFFGSGDTAAAFRILFEADQGTGRIVAGRRVTSYLNKFFGNTLDIEIHPYLPPGTILFWSDRVPYELPGVANILEAHVRQDYYQVQWPWSSMRHEFGVYVDEVFASYFMPAFAAISNLNPPSGVPSF